MDLVTACPFRALMAVFFAVPLGVIVGIYGTELTGSLKRRDWHLRRH